MENYRLVNRLGFTTSGIDTDTQSKNKIKNNQHLL